MQKVHYAALDGARIPVLTVATTKMETDDEPLLA